MLVDLQGADLGVQQMRLRIESCGGARRGTRGRGSTRLSVFVLWCKKDQRADLDTFARRRLGRTRRVLERSVGGEPRPAIVLGVVALEQHHFARLQVPEVIPAVSGVVG